MSLFHKIHLLGAHRHSPHPPLGEELMLPPRTGVRGSIGGPSIPSPTALLASGPSGPGDTRMLASEAL